MAEKFYDLRMTCPAAKCPNKDNKDLVALDWKSTSCKGKMQISQNGNLRCVHHATRPCVHGPMASFRFDCGLRGENSPHSIDEPFLPADRQSLTHAVSVGLSMEYLGYHDLAWVQELLKSLFAQVESQ